MGDALAFQLLVDFRLGTDDRKKKFRDVNEKLEIIKIIYYLTDKKFLPENISAHLLTFQ